MRPLVEPGPPLTPEETRRYARHLVLPGLGAEGQRRLAAARVLVVGAGGLGSPVLLYLAAAGVGTLGVVDGDDLDLTNLQRQVLHTTADVGRAKVDSAADAVAARNPHVTVRRHHVRLDPDNALDLLRGYDLVIDGADNFPTRYLVSDACELLDLPCVWGSIYRFDGQVSVFWRAPHDGTPGVTYRDVHPEPPAPGAVPSCEEAGVVGATCAAIGSAMALEAVKLITGLGTPLLGRVQVFEGLDAQWRSVPVRALPGREPVVSLRVGGDLGEDEPVSDTGEITPKELQGELAGEAPPALIDVREPWEAEIVSIPGSVLVPLSVWRTFTDEDAFRTAFADASGGRPAVVYCKSGMRSGQVQQVLERVGVDGVRNLRGGVLAWIDDVDPGQPKY